MVSLFVNPTTLTAFVAFLWYRKGRLWNFYDTFLDKCIIQITNNSLNRPAWEAIALEHCSLLSKEVFNSLFRFELEYLRNKITDNKHFLWIPDSETSSTTHTIYTNKEEYCKHEFKEIFFSDFRFCGVPLFINSIGYYFCKKENTEKGYTEKNVMK